jgi:pimeloyl-ACP methyl ester carboxylesterase
MKKIASLWALCLVLPLLSFGQVDTSFVYNPNAPFGVLDIRIAKSSSLYYYLQEDITFSFRESAPGVKSNTFRDMTVWDSSPYSEGNLREKNGSGDNFIMNYRLLKPQNYTQEYAQGYPLIIIMHGSGEKGNCWRTRCYHANTSYSPSLNSPPAPTAIDHELLNNDHNLLHGGSPHLKARDLAGALLPDDPAMPSRAFPGFVLFPQNLNGWTAGTVQDAIRIVRLLCKKYNIDQNRIYIQGLSNGGRGVYEAIKRAPWMFAAALPMSAIDDGAITAQNMSSEIANIPLWIFQGGTDENPSPSRTENYIKRFRDAGAVVKYTKYPTIGHSTWNNAYKEEDFFSWMLSKNKSNIHVFAGNPAICKGIGQQGLTLELAKGFKAYQWERNGQVIADATEALYVDAIQGTYRARFSRVANPTEEQWNTWSAPVTVTEQDAPIATIQQNGTVLLKDLNNNAEAQLQAVGDYAHYYWYKNGTLLNHPGDQDDTVRVLTIKPGDCSGTCTGNGIYTLVTGNFNNCSSTVSAPKHVYFNDQAPITITSPTNVKAYAGSASTITISWSDVSANEDGFEIWRRKVTGENSFSLWTMTILTAANVTSYKDTGLEPLATYQYKIRAVSSHGRSEYTPSGANEFIEASTTIDTEPPVAPEKLILKSIGIKKFLLSWHPATDNTGIKGYYVYYGADSVATNSADTTYIISDLTLNNVFDIRIKAIDFGGNLSAASNSVIANTFVRGLYYEHSTGSWPSLDSIDWSKPEFTGFIDDFYLTPKTQDDYFNFRYDGYLYLNDPGNYQFRTTSNDGSRLRLDDKLIVDNDGIHSFTSITSKNLTLTEGEHRIVVEFFDYTLTDSLLVEYKGPDSNNEWKRIPSSALKSSLITSNEVGHHPRVALQVSIFPNPSSQHEIHLQVQSIYNTPVHVKLIDQVGRSVYSNNFKMAQLREGTRLSPSAALTEGMYFISVQQDQHLISKKVIISND